MNIKQNTCRSQSASRVGNLWAKKKMETFHEKFDEINKTKIFKYVPNHNFPH